MTMTRLQIAVIGLSAFKRHGLAFVLGGLAALAMAPFYLLFFLIPAFTGLLWLVYGAAGSRGAFAAAWWFGVGFFTAGLYWIANALLTDVARYGWMIPIGVLGMSGGLALFPALAGLAARKVSRGGGGGGVGIGRVLVFAALWTTFEWLRGWVFTGFPWNLMGSAWAVSDGVLQMASLTGIYGLSLLTVALAALPATLATTDGWGGGMKPVLAAAVLLAVVWGGGTARLSGADGVGRNMVPDVRLRLVQPNIKQTDKWLPRLRIPNLKEQIAMSAAPAPTQPPTHVIWSETAATYYLSNDPAVRQAMARATPKGGLIISGAPRTTPARENPFKVWNSLYALDEAGEIVATYDKTHLVPFGEYMPFRGITGLEKLSAGSTDFSPGPGPQTLRLPGLPPVSPLICYEVIFPGNVVAAGDRPGWLLNLTNDAWYGISAGPYQHFDAARFRAVEEGLPLVRVANTGVSGVIDGYGRVVNRLNLGEKGILDSSLPKALSATVFSRFGNALALLLIVAVAAAGLVVGRLRGS